jgi:hypothetical protein
MTPTRWRKRPVVVDAVQVTADNVVFVIRWVNDDGGCAYFGAQGGVAIQTPEGVVRARVGDWVIREPFPTDERRFYPCKAAIFERAFDQEVPA